MSAILELLNIKSSGSLTCRSYQNLTFFCPFHLHPEYELVFIDRGHIEAFVGNQQHFLTQSELQLVASNIPHSFKLEGENQTAFLSKYMHVDPIILESLSPMIEFSFIQLLKQRFECGAVYKLNKVMKKQYLEVFHEHGAPRVLALLAFFIKLMNYQPVRYACDNYLLSNQTNYVMNQVIINAKSDLTLSQMASNINMSTSTLNRILKKAVGMSYVELVNHARVNLACNLLREGISTITEIGFDVGFKSSSQFNKVFKLSMKISPRSYRDSYQKLIPIEKNYDDLTWDVGEHS